MAKEIRTPMIETYDRLARVVNKGVLIATTPFILGVDTLVFRKSVGVVKKEIKHRLNVGEGRGRHLIGVNY